MQSFACDAPRINSGKFALGVQCEISFACYLASRPNARVIPNAYRKEQLRERSALRVPSYDARGNECVICPREILDRSFIVMRNIHQLSKHLVILLFIIWVHHCMQFRNCFLQRLIDMYNNADQLFLKTIFIVNLMLNSLLKNQVWQSTTRIKHKPVY